MSRYGSGGYGDPEPAPSASVPTQHPEQQHPGQRQPGHYVPSQQVPGQQVPGQQVPGQQVPGQQVPGQQVPGRQVPSQYAPPSGYPAPPASAPPTPVPNTPVPLGTGSPAGGDHPGFTNPGLANPGFTNPGFSNPGLANPGLASPTSPGPAVGHRASRSGRSWPGVLALVLVAVLLVGLGFQTWQLHQLDERLGQVNGELAQQQAYERERIDALEGRTGELERIAGEAFDPEAIAAAVLPSVFRVRAGDFGGTAFAVGAEAGDGGTNLFTNYHVVEQVWNQGDRDVALERTDQRYDAEIVDVDPEADVAWLRTDIQFDGLAVAGDPARSGQQIVAVGAPFGLTDTVTVGVVSAADRDDIRGAPGRWIQFDAPINPGNSGGPVINAAHEVVGIATAGQAEAQGIGLARPIDVACALFEVC